MLGFGVKKYFKRSLWVLLVVVVAYGTGRLYYLLTDGFALSNISSDYGYDPRWETRSLTEEEKDLVNGLLSQQFHYLGKGCQSYVFLSDDGEYVLKFFKYQRMRPRKWGEYFSLIPFIRDYNQKKTEKKQRKREGVYGSWKIAFDHLSEETGVVFVHLNKTHHLNSMLTIYDKMGFPHQLNIDDYEFMIQKRATMLCDHIDTLMAKGLFDEANIFLHRLIGRILSEYNRGIADNDHALMQNTGVCCGNPIHVDVGQFVIEDIVKDRNFHMQELFTKTYKFRLWLQKEHPKLCRDFDAYLSEVIGDDFSTMQPFWRNKIEIFQ